MERSEEISLTKIKPDPNQPRKHYSPHSINELAESFKRVGQIHAIGVRRVVTPDGNYYQIIYGERRWRAAVVAEFAEMLCRIHERSEDELLEIQMIENIQREDLQPLEECDAFHFWMTKKKQSLNDIASMASKSTDYIFGRMRLSALIPEAKQLLNEGILPVTAAIKISVLNEQQQTTAIKHLVITQTIHNKASKVFTGLRDLKSFFDNSVLLSLPHADFDPDVVGLLPCGSCIVCPKRTGYNNLFKDISEDDRCTDSKCYHDKHVSHYKILAFQCSRILPKDSEDPKHSWNIVYAARHYNAEKAFSDLGEVISMYDYELITEAQSKVEDHVRYAVFVGIDPTDGVNRPAHGWIKLNRAAVKKIENVSQGTPASSDSHVKILKKKATPSDKMLRDELYRVYIKHETNLRDSMDSGLVSKLWEFVDLSVVPPSVFKEFLRRYELSFTMDVYDTKIKDWRTFDVDEEYEHQDYYTPLSISPEVFVSTVDSMPNAKKLPALMAELEFLSILSKPIDNKFMKDSLDIDVNIARQSAAKRLAEIGKAPKNKTKKK